MSVLTDLLEEALRRAKAIPDHDIPPVRREKAISALQRIVLPAFPREVEHREVEALDGSHIESTELRGFGEEPTDSE